MPKRIQLRRTKGWRKPAGAVVVSRPSKWGNPYTVKMAANCLAAFDCPGEQDPHKRAVEAFRDALTNGALDITVDDVRRELRGKDLACWCPLPAEGEEDHCHGAVLLRIAAEGGHNAA